MRDDTGDVGVQQSVERLGAVSIAVPGQPVPGRQSSAMDLPGYAAVLVQSVPTQAVGRYERDFSLNAEDLAEMR